MSEPVNIEWIIECCVCGEDCKDDFVHAGRWMPNGKLGLSHAHRSCEFLAEPVPASFIDALALLRSWVNRDG